MLSLVFVIGNAKPPNHYPTIPEVCAPKCECAESPLIPGGANEGLMCGIGTISEKAQAFLLACFTFDAKERPSASDLVDHAFLADA